MNDQCIIVRDRVRSFPLLDLGFHAPKAAKNASTRRCRICWSALDDECEELNKTYVAPCECKGSMEFVHTDCLGRWSQHRHRRFRGQCDVCKKQLSCPGVQVCDLGPGAARRVWASQLTSTAIRLLQHYIVSLTLMGGLETAMNSIMASVAAYKQQQAAEGGHSSNAHVNNLMKALMGISIIRVVINRRVDVFSHLSKVRSVLLFLGGWIGHVVSERLVF